jgi:hypothetical protein
MTNQDKLEYCNALIAFLESKGGQLFVQEAETKIEGLQDKLKGKLLTIKKSEEYSDFEKEFFRIQDQIKVNRELLGEIGSLTYWLQEREFLIRVLQKDT